MQVIADLLPRLANLHAPRGIERVDRQLAVRLSPGMTLQAVFGEQRPDVLGEVELGARIGNWLNRQCRQRQPARQNREHRQPVGAWRESNHVAKGWSQRGGML